MKSLVSLGANLGKPRDHILGACGLIVDAFPQAQISVSHLFETPAVGGPKDQGSFYNAVLSIDGSQDAFQVWHAIREIEQNLGRVRNQRWEARRIDLDILFHEADRIWTPRLKIPHPRTCLRRFILEPCLEIAGDSVDPVSGLTLQALWNESTKNQVQIRVVAEDQALLQEVRRGLERELEMNSIPFRCEPNTIELPSFQVAYLFEALAIAPKSAKHDRHTRLEIARAIESSLSHQEGHHPGSDDHGLYLVGLVASPDPDVIAWEDHARPWSDALRISQAPQEETLAWNGPRYLLTANQTNWASHELLAMAQAIRCPVQRKEPVRI